MSIPVIDIFAGPGGLGEGFSSLFSTEGKRLFEIVLSIEKDSQAHQTLILRSFFRQFLPENVPLDYYEFIKGNISFDELAKRWPDQMERAKSEAWHATLGEDKDAVANGEVDIKISSALRKRKDWLLIGGPPCQAYSVVGRSRRKEKILDEKKDERVGLYKQYLRILAVHSPSVFVMENVKGLLSAETIDSPVFFKILNDLSDPGAAYRADYGTDAREIRCPGYKVYSLVIRPKSFDLEGNPVYNQKDYLIHAENYGIPQTRHRIIMLGIRKNIEVIPSILEPMAQIPLSKVIDGLPRLRSGLSKSTDEDETWKNIITQIQKRGLLTGISSEVKDEITKRLEEIRIPQKGKGADYISCNITVDYEANWFIDKNIDGICNHFSRSHMYSDLHRYFFASCFAKIEKRSPKLEDFPAGLLPDHQNVNEGVEGTKFADRFRVQLGNKPSKTITSHISKDGHYYIHPDPTQCRSFTVREAARIQTFPDNYFFCGSRTSQFHQVGNAVPPLLAKKIAMVVDQVFQQNNKMFNS